MKADSWILNELPEYLVQDWYNGLIYTESDMQACAYFRLRKQFERERSDKWIIRTEPRLDTPHGLRRPDIGLYRGLTAYDFIELKFQVAEGFRTPALDHDTDKLGNLKGALGVRHAYQIVLYDHEDVWNFGNKADWMKNHLTVICANVRRHHGSGFRRRGYDSARARWERGRKSKARRTRPTT